MPRDLILHAELRNDVILMDDRMRGVCASHTVEDAIFGALDRSASRPLHVLLPKLPANPSDAMVRGAIAGLRVLAGNRADKIGGRYEKRHDLKALPESEAEEQQEARWRQMVLVKLADRVTVAQQVHASRASFALSTIVKEVGSREQGALPLASAFSAVRGLRELYSVRDEQTGQAGQVPIGRARLSPEDLSRLQDVFNRLVHDRGVLSSALRGVAAGLASFEALADFQAWDARAAEAGLVPVFGEGVLTAILQRLASEHRTLGSAGKAVADTLDDAQLLVSELARTERTGRGSPPYAVARVAYALRAVETGLPNHQELLKELASTLELADWSPPVAPPARAKSRTLEADASDLTLPRALVH